MYCSAHEQACCSDAKYGSDKRHDIRVTCIFHLSRIPRHKNDKTHAFTRAKTSHPDSCAPIAHAFVLNCARISFFCVNHPSSDLLTCASGCTEMRRKIRVSQVFPSSCKVSNKKTTEQQTQGAVAGRGKCDVTVSPDVYILQRDTVSGCFRLRASVAPEQVRGPGVKTRNVL